MPHQSNGHIYDLLGRRQDMPKGVFIQDGKKYVAH